MGVFAPPNIKTMCLYPKFILNRKYLPNLKNKGNPPPITDERTRFVPVGCGKCMECRKQKSRKWQVRLQEEIKHDNRGKFITMTFSDESLIELESGLKDKVTGYNLDNEIATLATRKFLERWRKKYGTSVKHWLVTELGQNSTERIHIHGIIWTEVEKPVLEKLWKYGNVNKRDKDWKTNYCTERTVNYIVKYVNKIDERHKEYEPKILTSPGIGSKYLKRQDSKLNKFNDKKTNELYITREGIKLPLPTYYRNKIYTDEEREKLWLNLLDKKVRYVNGIKIDISKNDDEYYKVLEEQRRINKQLGYGDDEKNWERKKYEQDRRNLKKLERIEKQRRKNEEGF